MHLMKSAAVLIALCTLAACGGGGGSDGGIAGPVTTLQGPNETKTYDISSVTASFDASGTSGGSLDPLGTTDSTITVSTDANGLVSGITFDVEGSGGTSFHQTFTSVEDMPVTLASVAEGIQEISAAGAGSSGFFLETDGLSHSAFGGWMANNGSSVDVGMAAGGNLSLDTPTTGSATYTGKTFGVGATGTQSFAFAGDASLTADFAALTVTSSFSNLVTQDLNTNAIGSLPNIDGTATIDHFSDGTAGYDGTISSNGFDGVISGDFYGPSAAETAGTWQADNGATDLIGSFGAAQ